MTVFQQYFILNFYRRFNMTGRLSNAGSEAVNKINEIVANNPLTTPPPPQKATVSPLLAGVVAGALGYAFTKKPLVGALVGGAGLLGADYYNDKNINFK